MANPFTFTDNFQHTTSFGRSESAVWLTRLWNMACGLNGTDIGPAITRGLCTLATRDHQYEGEDFQLVKSIMEIDNIDLRWTIGNTGLLWQSHWQFLPEMGVCSRRDKLENTTSSPIEIRRCLARIPFTPGKYDIYTQSSNWARENQGHWIEFFGGRLSLRSHSGRTTQIANPYLFICETKADHGVAFHILPRGNWSMHVDRTSTTRDELAPFTVIELGLSDHALRLSLAPGETLELPEILIQDVPSAQPEAGAPNLHSYLNTNCFTSQKTAPLVYNTWFDTFDTLNVERLRQQLNVARSIGCEIFTIDAGWYGRGEGDWHGQVGDWREKVDGAFHNNMAAFAEEVRAAGLGFGLWVEPERNSLSAPIVQAHPEWYLPGLGGFLYPDLCQPAAYEYILGELSRLVETYQLQWMKVDFNFELGSSDDEHYGYFQHWYRLMDELRMKYPDTFFEGCASGGMRLDLSTLSHFDGHFLSDTVNPVDVLRITQGAMLRLPPGRISKWAVLRGAGEHVLTPGGGGSWEQGVLADVDFICRAAMPGMFGLSGDLISLSEANLSHLRHHIGFYKEWRTFMLGAYCHLLTPICSMDDRSGWIAFQLQNSTQPETSLLLVYRLLDGRSSNTFRLKDVSNDRTYSIINIDASDSAGSISGLDLHTHGLTVDLPSTNSAAILVLRGTPE